MRTRESKSGTLVKVVILPLLDSLSWKQLQISMGMLPIITNTSDELFNCINIDDYERPWTSKIRLFCWFLQSSAVAHTPRMNCNKMAGDGLTVREQKLVYAFVRLVSISSNFLLHAAMITSWAYHVHTEKYVICPLHGVNVLVKNFMRYFVWFALYCAVCIVAIQLFGCNTNKRSFKFQPL